MEVLVQTCQSWDVSVELLKLGFSRELSKWVVSTALYYRTQIAADFFVLCCTFLGASDLAIAPITSHAGIMAVGAILPL